MMLYRRHGVITSCKITCSRSAADGDDNAAVGTTAMISHHSIMLAEGWLNGHSARAIGKLHRQPSVAFSVDDAHLGKVELSLALQATMTTKSRREFVFTSAVAASVDDDEGDDIPYQEVVGTVVSALDARVSHVAMQISLPTIAPSSSPPAGLGTPGLETRQRRLLRQNSGFSIGGPRHCVRPFDITVSLRTTSLMGDDGVFDTAFSSPALSNALDVCIKRNARLLPTQPEFIKDFTSLSVRVYKDVHVHVSLEEIELLRGLLATLTSRTQVHPPGSPMHVSAAGD